jgi:hypothetical protein
LLGELELDGLEAVELDFPRASASSSLAALILASFSLSGSEELELEDGEVDGLAEVVVTVELVGDEEDREVP